MTLYQLKNKDGLYYRRGRNKHWVNQSEAAVWTTLKGVTSAKAKTKDSEIVCIPITWPKITLVKCGTWLGIYVNEILVTQQASLEQALKIIGLDVDIKTLDLNWMEGKASLPEKLEGICKS